MTTFECLVLEIDEHTVVVEAYELGTGKLAGALEVWEMHKDRFIDFDPSHLSVDDAFRVSFTDKGYTMELVKHDDLRTDEVSLADYLPSEIGWDLKQPCADCPFTKKAPFHWGVAGNLPTYIESIDNHAFAHTCHKTDMRPECDGPHSWDGKPQHCAGALMMLLKTGDGKDLQLPLLHAIEAGKFDVEEMTRLAKANANVFTLKELLNFYLQELKKKKPKHGKRKQNSRKNRRPKRG